MSETRAEQAAILNGLAWHYRQLARHDKSQPEKYWLIRADALEAGAKALEREEEAEKSDTPKKIM